MRQKRTSILIGSAAIGILAILLIVNYVRGVENRQQNSEQQVQVYTASSSVSQGAEGSQSLASGAIGISKISNQFKPADAIRGEDEIKGKVAIIPISPNTVITRGMFANPDEVNLSFQARLSQPGYVAVTTQLDPVRAAGGFISPGDYVNMMLYTTNEDGTGTLSMLYQKVRVLAVGNNATVGPSDVAATSDSRQAGNSGLLTFEVPQEAASLIASAGLSGGLYLTLVPNNYVPTEVPNISVTDLGAFEGVLPGQNPGILTPYGPEGFQGS